MTLRSRSLVVAVVLACSSVLLGSPAIASADEPTAGQTVTAAWRWLHGQLASATTVVSASTIAPSTSYPPSWTGPVTGTFHLSGVDVPPIDGAASLVVDSPNPLPGDYRASVTGHVTLPAEQGRWIIQVLRSTGSQTVQVPLQTLVAPDGTFALDLSAVPAQPDGGWGFEVLDAAHGYASTGPAWPTPGAYRGLEVRQYVTTDTAYLIGTAPALADGTFSFPSSSPGAKTVQLVDTRSGAVLAEWTPSLGLVRSYDVPVGDLRRGVTYTYDQALTLLSALSVGDAATAATVASGLVMLQTTGGAQDGGFVSSAAAVNPAAAQPEYRTGNHSVATYALLRYIESLPASDSSRPALVADARRAVDWLRARQVSSGDMAGLVTGGAGAYSTDGSMFDPDAVITWSATEHDLDAWHTLTLASTVLADPDDRTAANRLQDAIVSRLWDYSAGRFLQGWTPSGADPTEALDVNSWGAIFLDAIGRPDLASAALTHAQLFATSDGSVSGYAPLLPVADPALVWVEGTAGVGGGGGRGKKKKNNKTHPPTNAPTTRKKGTPYV
ncbi:MAG: hypothetical protein ACR2KJ_16655, partial [Jatrophihabitans sp.]